MKKFILLAAAAISLAACDSEDNNIDEPVAARISATIGETISRASDVKWDNGDNIGVFMSGLYTNVKYTTENADGVFKGNPMFFKNKQDKVTVSAYYPYTGTEGTTPAPVAVSTTVERQTPTEQSKYDFLYAVKENVSGAAPNINLTFNHRMSKLTLTFKKANDGTDVSKITSCRINGLILEGTFNPATGVCAANTSASASALNLTPTVKEGQALPSLLLLPQTVGKVTMNITDSDNQEYSCELKFDGNRIEAGNNYLYTIKVKKTGLNVEDYAIANWTEKTDESEAKSE